MEYESLLNLQDVKVGTSATTLSMLPTSKHRSDGGSAETGSAGEHSMCNICLEEFEEGDEKRRLPCLHEYHVACIDKWLEGSRKCPVCKTEVQ
jgi:hypothetical protein